VRGSPRRKAERSGGAAGGGLRSEISAWLSREQARPSRGKKATPVETYRLAVAPQHSGEVWHEQKAHGAAKTPPGERACASAGVHGCACACAGTGLSACSLSPGQLRQRRRHWCYCYGKGARGNRTTSSAERASVEVAAPARDSCPAWHEGRHHQQHARRHGGGRGVPPRPEGWAIHKRVGEAGTHLGGP
jgi:hypothetical protein